MEILRTPGDRFADLADYPYDPNYLMCGELRIHYVDQGNSDDETVLMLHGEPSWSYLYRKMIPIIANAGHRVIVPDLVGFGKSDKLANQEDYTYQRHVDWMADLVLKLDLKNITLFCQDWGGLIGLRIAAEHEDRFKRILAANTFLPTGDYRSPDAFIEWQQFSQKTPVFKVGEIIASACVSDLSDDIRKAYDAPFPGEEYKAGARKFPMLVPIKPDDPASNPNRKAWEVLKKWDKPFLTAFSDSDPITRGGDAYFHKLIPGTKGQAHTTIIGAGHFLQEDKGEELAELTLNFINNNPVT